MDNGMARQNTTGATGNCRLPDNTKMVFVTETGNSATSAAPIQLMSDTGMENQYPDMSQDG